VFQIAERGALDREETELLLDAATEAAEPALRDHAMTRQEERERVLPHHLPDRLRPLRPPDGLGEITVRHHRAPGGNPREREEHVARKRKERRQIERDGEDAELAGEVGVELAADLVGELVSGARGARRVLVEADHADALVGEDDVQRADRGRVGEADIVGHAGDRGSGGLRRPPTSVRRGGRGVTDAPRSTAR
jgi:hypothetical protein